MSKFKMVYEKNNEDYTYSVNEMLRALSFILNQAKDKMDETSFDVMYGFIKEAVTGTGKVEETALSFLDLFVFILNEEVLEEFYKAEATEDAFNVIGEYLKNAEVELQEDLEEDE